MDKQKWIPQLISIDTIDAQGQIDIQLDYNFSHSGRYTPSSQIEVVVTPVKHPYAVKQKVFTIFDQSNLPLEGNRRQPSLDYVDNIPNPFNPTTYIKYELLLGGAVEITIYDIMGRKVRTLFDGVEDPGLKSIPWDSTDDNGTALGTGFYFYTIKSGIDFKKGKMLLLK
tara:strand:- start:220 stop:726 length:507 start_codon:yes stop_codon:yes gene_type:complete